MTAGPLKGVDGQGLRPLHQERREDEVRGFAQLWELTLSRHAEKRLAQAGIDLRGQEGKALAGAFQEAQRRGGREALLLTERAAYIVDVPERKVITAIPPERWQGGVFTHIDTAVIWQGGRPDRTAGAGSYQEKEGQGR
ncbi:MAG: hypothetical protein QJR00_02710 [Bacillota bacterium]|nr:hypothetical protein [Bacillota bacterium]